MTDIFLVTYLQCQETQRNARIQNSRVLQRKEIAVWNSMLSCPVSPHLLMNAFDFKNSPYSVRILVPIKKKKKKNNHIAVWKTTWEVFLLGKIYIQLNLPESLVWS